MTSTRALITGASAGLGREFARQLASKGKDLILTARRTQPMEELARELSDEYGVSVDVIESDLSLPDGAPRLHDEVVSRGLNVDYLINNAGANGPDLLRGRDWPAHRRYVDLMMTSVTALCHYFIPAMCERGFGRVLNVASVAGRITIPGDYSYGPTKAYLIALSKGLSVSLRSSGVNVLALCPGFTHTDFHAGKTLSKMKSSTPSFIWYNTDVVVREGLAALEKGKAVHTSGRLYRFLVPILQTPLSSWVMGKIGVQRDY